MDFHQSNLETVFVSYVLATVLETGDRVLNRVVINHTDFQQHC